jgi:hypothetical protein
MDLTFDTVQEFHLLREEDVSGTSGVGVVARGVKLPSGACVLEWCTFHSSIAIYKNVADVEAIHGHGGKTKLVMGPPPTKVVDTSVEERMGPKKRKPRKKKEVPTQ